MEAVVPHHQRPSQPVMPCIGLLNADIAPVHDTTKKRKKKEKKEKEGHF